MLAPRMRFLLAILVVLSLAGCGEKEFTCTAGRQCIDRYGASGLCLQMHCAFPAGSCDSGYKWDDAAGENAGKCVDQALIPPDAGAAAADARP
jgi:hypothetical protein